MFARKHEATALSGEGARLYGGRWNTPGVAALYASSSLALALLE
ncbi:MAG: RES domain-containing protein, partial [Vulcanimicrobiaceae bacterium]